VTQIAHARTFDGVDDFLEMSIGGLDAALTSMSIVSIIKPVDAAVFRDILVVEDPLGFAFGLGPTSQELYFYNGVALDDSSGNFADAANGWMIIALTKPSGSSVVRWHKYVYGTQTWTHEAGATSLAQPATPTSLTNIYIGGQTEFNGMIACLGYWPTVALSDGTLESMVSLLSAWEATSPGALWLLDQSSETIAVDDRIGSADQVNRTGTTATAISDLDFYIGGAPPTVTPKSKSAAVHKRRRM